MNTYGELLITALRAHEQGARRSGRTERMLQTLPAKATVVCLGWNEAERLRHILRTEYGREDVDFIVCGEASDEALAGRLRGKARVRGSIVLDHSWEQKYWENKVVYLEQRLAGMLQFFRNRDGVPHADQSVFR